MALRCLRMSFNTGYFLLRKMLISPIETLSLERDTSTLRFVGNSPPRLVGTCLVGTRHLAHFVVVTPDQRPLGPRVPTFVSHQMPDIQAVLSNDGCFEHPYFLIFSVWRSWLGWLLLLLPVWPITLERLQAAWLILRNHSCCFLLLLPFPWGRSMRFYLVKLSPRFTIADPVEHCVHVHHIPPLTGPASIKREPF